MRVAIYSIAKAEAWGDLPYDLAAISSFNLGLFNKAVEYGEVAGSLSADQRLVANLELYRSFI